MKIRKLWIVTQASGISELADILFSVDVPDGLARQFAGGLTPDRIVGMYATRRPAELAAKAQLKKFAPRRAGKGMSRKYVEGMLRDAPVTLFRLYQNVHGVEAAGKVLARRVSKAAKMDTRDEILDLAVFMRALRPYGALDTQSRDAVSEVYRALGGCNEWALWEELNK